MILGEWIKRLGREFENRFMKTTKFDIDILRILSGDLKITTKDESIEVRATKEHMDALTRLMILGFAESKKRQNGKLLVRVSKAGKKFLKDIEQETEF